MKSKDMFAVGDAVLARSQIERFPREIRQLDREFIVLENVFSPDYLPAAESFARALPFRQGLSFLEIGPGVGVVAIAAALAGAERVVAIDINPDAVENTRINFARHGLDDRAVARHGDLFDALLPEETFDLIFWNLPFFVDGPRAPSLLQRSIVDPGYDGARRYLVEGPEHLKPAGKLTLGFSSTVGDLAALEAVAAAAGRRLEVIHREDVPQYSPRGEPMPFSLEIFEVLPRPR
jgi:methylase of polypeptide subunit release factors